MVDFSYIHTSKRTVMHTYILAMYTTHSEFVWKLLFSSCRYGPLIKQLQVLQDRTHGQQDWSRQSVVVTCGSCEPMANVFDMILSEGDSVIIPIPLYTATADAVSIIFNLIGLLSAQKLFALECLIVIKKIIDT